MRKFVLFSVLCIAIAASGAALADSPPPRDVQPSAGEKAALENLMRSRVEQAQREQEEREWHMMQDEQDQNLFEPYGAVDSLPAPDFTTSDDWGQ